MCVRHSQSDREGALIPRTSNISLNKLKNTDLVLNMCDIRYLVSCAKMHQQIFMDVLTESLNANNFFPKF